MKLLCIHAPYYEKAYVEDFERLEEYHGSEFLINVADMQPYEQINLIKKIKTGRIYRHGQLGVQTWDSHNPYFGWKTTDVRIPGCFVSGAEDRGCFGQ